MTSSSAVAGTLFKFITILRPLPTLSSAGNFRIFSINGNSTFDQNVRTRFINTSATKCLPKLLDIGKEQPEKDHYNTGQLIIHKIFEYRGVVLFPWRTELYDRDITTQSDAQAADDQSDDADDGQLQKQQHWYKEPGEIKAKSKSLSRPVTYYCVLIDSRDKEIIKNRHPSDYATFLDAGNVIYYDGLDYVAHTDLLPFETQDNTPIQHAEFDKFFVRDGTEKEIYQAQTRLTQWREKHTPQLALSDVFRETTEDLRVTAIPFFMGHQKKESGADSYWWRYSIRIENIGLKTVQLAERHFRIVSNSGVYEQVKAKGIHGAEPLMTPGMTYQYSAHVNLQSQGGHMWGSFRMVREDGTTFDCRIPSFTLKILNEDGPPLENDETPIMDK